MSELIKKQYVRTRQRLSQTLEDVTLEVASYIPEGFNNNIHWQVGHLFVTAELLLFRGQEQLPNYYRELFATNTKPTDWTVDVPSIEILLKQLDEQLLRIIELSDEAFTKNLPKPFIGNETTGEVALFGAFHEALHLGQIQTIKRHILALQTSK